MGFMFWYFIQGKPKPDVRMTHGQLKWVHGDPERIANKTLRQKVIRYHKMMAWRNLITQEVSAYMLQNRLRLIGKGIPIKISATFWMPNTKKSAPGSYHVVTPDTDNLLKPVKDALKGIAWHDDNQVCVYGRMEKRYAKQGGYEGVEIEIESLARCMG